MNIQKSSFLLKKLKTKLNTKFIKP